MAAVHASSLCLRRSEIAENRIVTLFLRGSQISENTVQILHSPEARQNVQHAGFVQRILDALIFRQSFSKGRKFGVQKSSAAEGLHNGNADFFLLAALIEIHTLIGGTDGKIAMAVIIGRIDAEHHHIQKARIQHLIDDGRRVGGKTNVTNNALFFQLLDMLQRAAFQIFFEIRRLIDAVDETKVDVVRVQLFQKPVHAADDLILFRSPAVFSGRIVGSKMHLKTDFVTVSRKGSPIIIKSHNLRHSQIKVVDTAFHGF